MLPKEEKETRRKLMRVFDIISDMFFVAFGLSLAAVCLVYIEYPANYVLFFLFVGVMFSFMSFAADPDKEDKKKESKSEEE